MDAESTITLEPEDVPGAVLCSGVNIEDHSNLELKRWLECRGLKQVGTKAELIQRIVNCINAGSERVIFIGVDGGKWYDAKRNVVDMATSSTSQLEPVTSVSIWNRFPSVDVPPYFNKGHIYTYIAGPKIEDEEFSVNTAAGITEKPFRRGSQYVSSDYIYNVHDAVYNKHYHLKACCYASFKKKVYYEVAIILNQLSGAVLKGTCNCKQSALGKCSHVSALLLFLSKFVEENGYNAVSPTSKLREWGLGAKKKHPGPVASQVYPVNRWKPLTRASFDPRPRNYTRDVDKKEFTCSLQSTHQENMFQTLFEITYEDFKINATEENILKQQVRLFKENMREYMDQYKSKIFAIRGAEVQGTLDWLKWRTYFFTASNVKTAISLTKGTAKTHYLKKNLWQLTPTYCLPGVYYGRKYEPVARQAYAQRYLTPFEKLVEVGLYANKEYPHLACSVDGLVFENNIINRIIEIKCPKILENKNPKKFNEILTKQQLQNFFLCQGDGQIEIRLNHPYLYQIATSMLIFDVPCCDLIIWSKIDILVLNVRLEQIPPHVISDITIKLKKLYYNMYVPEFFLMKIPRNLPLLEIDL